MISHIRIQLAVLALSAATLVCAQPVHAANLNPGTLIKGPSDAVYYYAANGKRLVFPNLKTYQTWYSDFNDVTTISLGELSALPLGGNVTYRPGARLVKVTTDPKVYAVGSNGTLRWVETEEAARALYGSNWNTKVDDLPDEFFVNYTVGTPIVNASDYSPSLQTSAAVDINTDKHINGQPAPEPAPVPLPIPAPQPTTTSTTPTPTQTTSTLTFSSSQNSVRGGDTITLTAMSLDPIGVQKIELFFDGTLIQTCPSKSCSGETQIPLSGTKPSYVAETRVTKNNLQVENQTLTLAVTTGPSNLVHLHLGKSQIMTGQTGSATVQTDSALNILRTDIFVDNTNVKGCGKGLTTCQWSDYLNGAVSSTHPVYAIVTDTIGRTYQSTTQTITISTLSSPSITISPAKSQIYVGESVDVTVFASDDNGVTSIDVMKDGTILKHCVGGAPCTATTGPWNSAGILNFSGQATNAQNVVGTDGVETVSVIAH